MTTVLDNTIGSMRATVESLCLDECVLGTPSYAGTMEPTAETWSWSSTPVRCMVDVTNARESRGGEQAEVNEITIRIPYDIQTEGIQRIRVTKRVGTTLSDPEEYSIVGAFIRGITLQVAKARRVVGGSIR